MKVDALCAGELTTAAEIARAAERLGCDGLVVPEVAHDPFLPLGLAAAATERIQLTTGIAVAFARNPMTVAVVASDLHRFSGGRLTLGLGSQIKPHITRRFSMPWSQPAARMREFVQALRAIWTSWDTGDKLDFRGDFYQHTLMTPMFSHGPSPVGHPKVYVAAVGPAMTAVAGEVADGLCTHGFTTAEYVRQVTIPHLEEGLKRAGRTRADVEVTIPAMTAIVEDERDSKLDSLRATIAFYGSTPAYRPVLDLHGFGALGDELHTLSVRGDWAAMAKIIPDELVHTMAVVGSAAEVGKEIRSRYAGAADRIQTSVLANDAQMLDLIGQLSANDSSDSVVG